MRLYFSLTTVFHSVCLFFSSFFLCCCWIWNVISISFRTHTQFALDASPQIKSQKCFSIQYDSTLMRATYLFLPLTPSFVHEMTQNATKKRKLMADRWRWNTLGFQKCWYFSIFIQIVFVFFSFSLSPAYGVHDVKTKTKKKRFFSKEIKFSVERNCLKSFELRQKRNSAKAMLRPKYMSRITK